MLDSVFTFFNELFQEVITYIASLIEWLFDLLLWVPEKLFGLLMDALGDGLLHAGDVVCVRACIDAVNGIGSSLAQLPAVITFTFPYIHLATGVELIICAYIVRFVIRRIPLIG